MELIAPAMTAAVKMTTVASTRRDYLVMFLICGVTWLFPLPAAALSLRGEGRRGVLALLDGRVRAVGDAPHPSPLPTAMRLRRGEGTFKLRPNGSLSEERFLRVIRDSQTTDN
jgi:hypothetical protein